MLWNNKIWQSLVWLSNMHTKGSILGSNQSSNQASKQNAEKVNHSLLNLVYKIWGFILSALWRKKEKIFNALNLMHLNAKCRQTGTCWLTSSNLSNTAPSCRKLGTCFCQLNSYDFVMAAHRSIKKKWTVEMHIPWKTYYKTIVQNNLCTDKWTKMWITRKQKLLSVPPPPPSILVVGFPSTCLAANVVCTHHWQRNINYFWAANAPLLCCLCLSFWNRIKEHFSYCSLYKGYKQLLKLYVIKSIKPFRWLVNCANCNQVSKCLQYIMWNKTQRNMLLKIINGIPHEAGYFPVTVLYHSPRYTKAICHWWFIISNLSSNDMLCFLSV